MNLMVQEPSGQFRPASHNEIRKAALEQLAATFQRGAALSSPQSVKDFLALRLNREHEVFAVLFLDSQHQVLSFEEMFRGTLNQTSVYPREIVKRAVKLNAGAVVLAHNHPSGLPEPSRADEFLTQSLKTALAVIDVRVLDHIVVAGASSVSFAERGLL